MGGVAQVQSVQPKVRAHVCHPVVNIRITSMVAALLTVVRSSLLLLM